LGVCRGGKDHGQSGNEECLLEFHNDSEGKSSTCGGARRLRHVPLQKKGAGQTFLGQSGFCGSWFPTLRQKREGWETQLLLLQIGSLNA
jgi:hypothetical protein